MIHWTWLIPAFMFGGMSGVVTLALVSAGRDDR